MGIPLWCRDMGTGEEIWRLRHPGVLAKQDLLLKVENNKNCVLYAECVAEYILMDAALSKKRDLFVTKAGAEVEAAAQQRISRLLSMLEEGLIGEDILKVLQESKHAYRGCSPSEFRELIGRDREACTNAFQATQSQLQPMLEKQDSSFLGLQQQWETAQDEYQQEVLKFYMLANTFASYRRRVLPPSYHLSDKELQLAAHVYNKRVILFSDGAGTREINSEGSTTVIIFHEGNQHYGHYSRLV